MASRSRFASVRSALGLLKNPLFLGGLGILVVLGVVLVVLFNSILLPTYVRHDTVVSVPDVSNMSIEEARQTLARQDFQVETEVQRFNPSVPRDVVVSQNPLPGSDVKPGRRVYLTINSGEVPRVQIPNVEGFSLREAQNRMTAIGLTVEDMRPDSVPSPHYKTITRQEPAAGESVQEGTGVTLWYSTGPGDRFVALPQVTDLTVEEARALLLENNLRAVVFGLEEDEDPAEVTVKRQSQEPGTRVREGFEVRLFVDEQDEAEE